MQTLQPKTTLQGGKYKIISTLGQGGFGITYLAEQTMLGRKVAVKEFFYKEFCDREEGTSHITFGTSGNRENVQRFMKKFLKEARTISQLDHPNIIKIYDIFEENGTAYYVMEYIEGENLSELVKRQGTLSEVTAVGYIKKVADALAYIHAQNINHLDVKPGNIMLRQLDQQIVLIDFGLSKQYDDVGSQTSSTPVGISQGYAPIEQYRPGGVAQFTPQTDIYSLGATLYWLIIGKTPPPADEILDEGLPAIPAYVSLPVKKAIENAMQVKKKNRPQNVKTFLEMLDVKQSAPYSPSKSNDLSFNDATRILQEQSVNTEKTLNGYHKKKFKDGSLYEGYFVKGKPEGKGTMKYVGGASYIGEWHNGLRHGQGTWYYPNGDSYIGEWKEARMHGKGKLIKKDGTEIEGVWKDDKMVYGDRANMKKPVAEQPENVFKGLAKGCFITLLIILPIAGIIIGVSQCEGNRSDTPGYVYDDAVTTMEEEQKEEASHEDAYEQKSASSKSIEQSRKEALDKFSGKFSIVAPGAMKGGITWAYDMELDPVNSSCQWVMEDLVDIRNSKGYCGTFIKMEEAWEVYRFSLHNDLTYAIVEMRRVDDFYEGENQVCKVKLELDEFNNIKMSFIDGNAAPYPLWNDDGTKYNRVATFYRE